MNESPISLIRATEWLIDHTNWFCSLLLRVRQLIICKNYFHLCPKKKTHFDIEKVATSAMQSNGKVKKLVKCKVKTCIIIIQLIVVSLTNVQLQVFKLYGLEITSDDLLKDTLFELFGKSSQLPHHEVTSRSK